MQVKVAATKADANHVFVCLLSACLSVGQTVCLVVFHCSFVCLLACLFACLLEWFACLLAVCLFVCWFWP